MNKNTNGVEMKMVLVKVGRGGTKVHGRWCEMREGYRGFTSNHPECGQVGIRSSLSVIKDNATADDMAKITCADCRKALGLV